MNFLLGLLTSLLVTAGGPRPLTQYYVDVPYQGAESVRDLTALGYEVAGIDLERGMATVIVTEDGLRATGNLDVRAVRPILAPDQKFKKYADIEQILKDTEKNFPHLASVESIGRSNDGRDILAIQLTSRFVGGNKPTLLFDAMHHAREIMTPEVAVDIVEYLTQNYARDAKVREWLDKYEVWVVPMLNPDGNDKVWHTNSMWRKNTRDGHGVDNNRNYPYAWNSCNGSSGNKNSDTYRGASAGSEPETQAIMALAKRIRPVFNISYHSYSEIVIYPFGCSPKKLPEPDRAIYEGVGRELAQKLVRDSGSGTYKAGTSYELLYDVDGGSVDHMYASDKIMSFVIEINSSSQGFQPGYDKWRDVTVKKQRAGWMYILDRMSGPGIRPPDFSR